MPRRALPRTPEGGVEVPAHLLLQGEHGGTAQERGLRRYLRWRLSPFMLTSVEALAKRLHREGRTADEILAEIAGFGQRGKAQNAYLTAREKQQVASIRKALEGTPTREADPEKARRTMLRWLAKGRLRRRVAPTPPPPGVPVWVDWVRCTDCGREEARLRKYLTRRDVHGREQEEWAARLLPLLPSGEEGFSYCRTRKRRRRFRVVESRLVPEGQRRALVEAYSLTPPLRRSRFLLDWLRSVDQPEEETSHD